MVEEFNINKGILYSPLESPRPPPAHCPSPFSDLFTQIHLTFVWFVWLEFFSFFTSRIVDFCWLPFIFTLVTLQVGVNFLSCLFHFASVLYTEITITFTFSQQGGSLSLFLPLQFVTSSHMSLFQLQHNFLQIKANETTQVLVR